MCDLIVVTRPGYDIGLSKIAPATVVDLRNLESQAIGELLRKDDGPRVFVTDAAMVDVSATRIRAAVQANDATALKGMVPPAIARYIDKYNLYRN
jgi:nicotinic acid mononucleotide adenylyltransferase